MARPDHLYVFTYDVEMDGRRVKLAKLLDEWLDRVQFSVFEGRLSLREARKLATKASLLLGPEDSLRVYCIPENGRALSMAFGRGQLPEAGDFLIV